MWVGVFVRDRVRGGVLGAHTNSSNDKGMWVGVFVRDKVRCGVFVRDRECGLVCSLGIGNVGWCIR